MSFSFEPLSLTQIAVSTVTVLGSLLVAFFTSKKEMKKHTYEKRSEAYSDLFSFLRDFKRIQAMRESYGALDELLNIEVKIKLFGSKSSVSQLVNFRKQFEQSLSDYDEWKADLDREISGEKEQMRESGESELDIESKITIEFQQRDCPYLMTDDEIDVLTRPIIYEARRALGQRELWIAIWLRNSWLYKKIWV